MNYENWSDDHLEKLELVKTYAQMAKVALALLEAMPQPIVQVCGPLTTGGRGSFEKNMEALGKAIETMARKGFVVFDQRPFQNPMLKLIATRKDPGYATELLLEFYLPIFKSGYIKEFYFLSDWQSSTGASWEHEQAKRLGIKVSYL